MSKMIWIVPIEPVETRYTWDWYEHIPKQIKAAGLDVCQINVEMEPPKADKSDFLNWTATNIFKARQVEEIARRFENGEVKNGDVFLFTDFWNPCVVQVRYMAVMLGIDIKIVGLAHAGAYDNWDRLSIKSREYGNILWAIFAEQSFDFTYDKIVFATEFHRNLFEATHGVTPNHVVAGFPMEYIDRYTFSKPVVRGNKVKIIYSQRLAPEKQPEMFEQLKELLGNDNYTYVNVLEKYSNPTKDQYYSELLSSDIYVSFSLQETLGITPFEAYKCGCAILVPDRLSYTEIWEDQFKYPSDETVEEIAQRIEDLVLDSCYQDRSTQRDRLDKYFGSKQLMEILRNV